MRIISESTLYGYSETEQRRVWDEMMNEAEALPLDAALDPLSRAVMEHPTEIDLPALRTLLAATESCNPKEYDANRWQYNGIGWYVFATPNDTLRLDRTEHGYRPTIGALTDFHAVSYRFGISLEQAHDLFDAERMFNIDGGEKTTGAAARLKFVELLADFIASNEEGGGL